MFPMPNQQQNQPQQQFPSVGGLLGMGGLAFICCIGGGFLFGTALFLAYVVAYQAIALVVYTVRYVIRSQQLARELEAARTAAGDLALPVARPAVAGRIVWANAPRAARA